MLNDEIAELFAILKHSKAEVIEGQKCFVQSRDQFLRAASIVRNWSSEFRTNGKLAAAGWENMEANVTQLDEGIYYIVCKDVPRIDTLWNELKK